MSTPENKSKLIHDFLTSEIANEPELIVDPNDDLLLTGMLDSVNVVRLVSYIEEICEIKIPPEDILLENFGSLQQIDDYLNTRL